MKNFVRICIAVLVLGIVCCIGGAAAGGRLYTTVRGNTLLPFELWEIPRLHPAEEDHTTSGSGRHGIRSSVWEPASPSAGDGLPEITDELPPVTSLKELDFELGAGNYTIVSGTDYGLEFDGNWVDSEIDHGVWKIHTSGSWLNFGIGEPRSCTIIVPAGCAVDKLALSVGAANLEVYAPITAKKADLEVGAGNLSIDALDFSEKLDAEVGAGNLDLGLAGKQEDYRVNANVAMGTISINGRDLVTGLAGSASKGDGPRQIQLDVGMGNISIYTEE